MMVLFEDCGKACTSMSSSISQRPGRYDFMNDKKRGARANNVRETRSLVKVKHTRDWRKKEALTNRTDFVFAADMKSSLLSAIRNQHHKKKNGTCDSSTA